MMNENDIERMIKEILPIASKFLEELSEFFPFGGVINKDDTVTSVALHTGNDNPESQMLIDEFKKAFRANKNEYKAIAIFYDVLTDNPLDNFRTDAVAIFAETVSSETAFIYYYPYTIAPDRTPVYGDRWKVEVEKEVYKV